MNEVSIDKIENRIQVLRKLTEVHMDLFEGFL